MAEDTNSPHMPHYTYAPENFRKIMNRQMNNSIGQEVDSIVKFSKGNADGRFSSSRPSHAAQIKNSNGYFYFVVGFSRTGDLSVAAP